MGRLHHAHLDTGMLPVAVAVGAGDIPSAATDDDDQPNMLRAGSADISSPLWRVSHVALRAFELGSGRVILSGVYDAPEAMSPA
jgi:hypothetical protein